MSDESKMAGVLNQSSAQSSPYAGLTPDLRRRIDKAIADPMPPPRSRP